MNNPKNNLLEKKEASLEGFLKLPISPRYQFRILMIVTTLVFISLVFFHMYLLQKINSHTIYQVGVVSDVPAETVSQSKLTAVLGRYDAKSAVRANALQKTPAFVEPSK